MTISDTPGEGLDPKALEAAQRAYTETLEADELGDASHVIRAYLAALSRATVDDSIPPEFYNTWCSTNVTPPAPQPSLALIEECARIAEKQGHIDWEDGDGGQYGHGYESACSDIATELRALASAKRFKEGA